MPAWFPLECRVQATARDARLIGRAGDPMIPQAALFLVRANFPSGGSFDPPFVGAPKTL